MTGTPDGVEAPRFVRRSLTQLPDGTPLPTPERIGRELGLDRLLSLGLNEGLDGPFPAALEALGRVLPALQRYPGRGSLDLCEALAERHGVAPGEVFVAAGADAVIGYVCQATLDPGDEVVTAWPSFPSFVSDTLRRDAVPVRVPLVDGRIDLEALRAAVTARTKIVFVASPNNPTGLALDRDAAAVFVDRLPEHVLPVIDEAYFDYLDPATRLDSIEHLFRGGRTVLALRTFSKLYGLAGLRVGYGVGPADVIEGMRRMQRGYDVSSAAQVAALASLADDVEVARRREATRAAVRALTLLLAEHGLHPLEGSEANFVLARVGAAADALTAALLRAGIAVQPGAPFGAPHALRITAGTSEQIEAVGAALRLVKLP